jgi:uncharacterized protein YkwD
MVTVVRLVSACLIAAVTLPLTAAGGAKDDVEKVRARTFELVNQFRQEQGRKALTMNAKLTAAAQKHAEALAKLDKAGDDGKNPHILDGKRAPQRITAEGYKWSAVNENVSLAIRQADPGAAAVKGWKGSPGHRKNMLIAERTETGIGVGLGKAGKVWIVQLYATPAK